MPPLQDGPVLRLKPVEIASIANYQQTAPELVRDNKLLTWSFRPDVLESSAVAKILENRVPITGSLSDLPSRLNDFTRSGNRFNDADRAALRAVQDDLTSRPPLKPEDIEPYWRRMAELERICRDAGLPPKPDYPGLERAISGQQAAPAVAGRFSDPGAAEVLRTTVHRYTAVMGHSLHPIGNGSIVYPDTIRDGKVAYWAFDQNTTSGSRVAAAVNGHAAGSHVADLLQQRVRDLRDSGYQFNDMDRAVMKALLEDLGRRRPTQWANEANRNDYERQQATLRSIQTMVDDRTIFRAPSPGAAPSPGGAPIVSNPPPSAPPEMQNPNTTQNLMYVRIGEGGQRITLGHSLQAPVEGHVLPAYAMKDGQALHWGFDKATYAASPLARHLEGQYACMSSVAGLQRKIEELRTQGYTFIEQDKAVIKALQIDLDKRKPATFPSEEEQRQYEAARDNLERLSRMAGNAPSPGYPNLDSPAPAPAPAGNPDSDPFAGARAAHAHLSDFLDKLEKDNPAAFAAYVNPGDPPAPLPRGDEMWGYGYSQQQLQDLEEWREKIRDFESKLTPEQRAEWNKIGQEMRDTGVGFHAGYGPTEVPPPVTAQPEAPPARDFSISMHTGPGPIAFNADVLEAQKLMKQLGALMGEEAINLGRFKNHENDGHEGLDGKFGAMTENSVKVAQIALGMSPADGKITDEFIAKMKEKIAELNRAHGVTVTAPPPEPVPTVSAPVPQTLTPPVLELPAVYQLPDRLDDPDQHRTALTAARTQYQADATAFYNSLTPELKAMFTDPLGPFSGTDENGRPHMWGILQESAEAISGQYRANLERFEAELRKQPNGEALLAQWELLKRKAGVAGIDFDKPEDDIPRAPNAPYENPFDRSRPHFTWRDPHGTPYPQFPGDGDRDPDRLRRLLDDPRFREEITRMRPDEERRFFERVRDSNPLTVPQFPLRDDIERLRLGVPPGNNLPRPGTPQNPLVLELSSQGPASGAATQGLHSDPEWQAHVARYRQELQNAPAPQPLQFDEATKAQLRELFTTKIGATDAGRTALQHIREGGVAAMTAADKQVFIDTLKNDPVMQRIAQDPAVRAASINVIASLPDTPDAQGVYNKLKSHGADALRYMTDGELSTFRDTALKVGGIGAVLRSAQDILREQVPTVGLNTSEPPEDVGDLRDTLASTYRMQGEAATIDQMVADAWGMDPEAIAKTAQNGLSVEESLSVADTGTATGGPKIKGLTA